VKIKYKNFFIVKDKGVAINWKKPLLQEGELSSMANICLKPFASGALRYAFYMYDGRMKQKMVAKLPKIIDENYCL
jgi:hypothetical protein